MSLHHASEPISHIEPAYVFDVDPSQAEINARTEEVLAHWKTSGLMVDQAINSVTDHCYIPMAATVAYYAGDDLEFMRIMRPIFDEALREKASDYADAELNGQLSYRDMTVPRSA